MTTGGTFQMRAVGEKVVQLSTHVVMGSSGDSGMIQRVTAALQGDEDGLSPDRPPEDIRDHILATLEPIFHAAVARHVAYPNTAPEFWVGLFIGWNRADDDSWLLTVFATGASQFSDGHTAIGSHQPMAHLALVSVEHLLPNYLHVDLVKAVAYRAIDNTCKAAAQYVGPPVQMGYVTRDGAEVLDLDEINLVEETCALWQQREVEILWGQDGGDEDEDGDSAHEPSDDQELAALPEDRDPEN